MRLPPVLLVAAGGVVGSLGRAAVGELVPHRPGTWAWSTLLVNAVGAAALCALLVRLPSRELRLLVGTGLLGGFTTFSAFAVDAVLLADAGRTGVAAAYVVVGVTSLLAGGLIGRSLGRRGTGR